MVDFTPGRQQALSTDEKKGNINSAVFKISNAKGEAMFSELAGINSEVEMVEYMEAGVNGPVFGRFFGKAKPPTVTLKRAMGSNKSTTWIWGWHALARKAAPEAYSDVTLQLIGSGGTVKAYMLRNAVAAKVEIAGAKAGASEVIIQTLTIQCDEIEETQP